MKQLSFPGFYLVKKAGIYICFFSIILKCYTQSNSGMMEEKLFQEAVNLHLTQPDSAEKIFLYLLPKYETSKDWYNHILTLQGLSRCKIIAEDYSGFEYYASLALKEAEFYYSKQNPITLSSATNFAEMLIVKGAYDEAILAYQNSSSSYKLLASKDSSTHYNAYLISLGNTATAYTLIGDYENAIKNYEKLVSIRKNEYSDKGVNYIDALFCLGEIYLRKNELKNSLSCFNRIFEIQHKLGNSRIRNLYFIEAKHSSAFVLLKQEKIKELTFTLNELIEIHSSITNNPYKIQVLYELQAERHKLLKNYDSAYLYFQKALKVRQKVYDYFDHHLEIVESYQSIADLLILQNKIGQAIANYNLALQLPNQSFKLPASPQYLALVPILDGKAQAHIARYKRDRKTQDLDTAMWCYQVADSLVDKARDRLQNEGSKLFFTQKSRPIYEHAIQLCLDMYQSKGGDDFLEKAFYFSERNKATMLFQSLQEAGAKVQAGLPDSLLSKEKQLKVDIAFYQRKIFEGEHARPQVDSSRLESWKQILFDLEEAYRQLSQRLEKDFPEYFKLKYSHKITRLPDLQSQLHKGEMLIEYFVGDNTIYVFGIEKKGIQIHQIKRKKEIDQFLDDFIACLNQPKRGRLGLTSYTDLAYKIYDSLLEPILHEKKINQLIVVPDGKLSYIPIEALLIEKVDLSGLDDKQANRLYKSLPYLFQKYSLRYGYSSTLQFQNPIKTPQAEQKFLALAPAYSGKWHLHFNQPQAREISLLMNGKIIEGEEANKASFLNQMGHFQVLHLAMHAEPDLDSPLMSFLRFEGPDSLEESKFFAYELYNSQIQAKMVVLAACETAFGKLETGEGVYSLTRAFRFAGCPAVVSSLWKADGEATIQFMKAFYKQLEKGKQKSKALQIARSEYLNFASNDKCHPYYWANFVIIGEDDPIESSFSWVWMVCGAILFLGTLSFFFIKK